MFYKVMIVANVVLSFFMRDTSIELLRVETLDWENNHYFIINLFMPFTKFPLYCMSWVADLVDMKRNLQHLVSGSYHFYMILCRHKF